MWKQCEPLQSELISLRRELHKVPEVGFDLPRTRALICRTLDGWGVDYQLSSLDSAVLGEIRGGRPGKTLLLRADIDALPIQEENPVPYASTHPGKMHACGHDAHAAMLLGAIKVLHDNRAQLQGNVKFVFQTAEETVNGAVKAIEAGALDGVDAVFGCHIGNLLGADVPSGTFSIAPGCVMASVDSFKITVRGRGCHGSSPEKGVDPITIAAHIVINLQEILAREIAAAHPISLTVGRIQGGQVYNIIPDTVEVDGSLRALSPATREFVLKRIGEIAQSTAATFRGSCDVCIRRAADAVINDEALALLAQRAARKVVGEDFVQTSFPSNMGSEDFSDYLALKPGVFYFLSSAGDESTRIPHHNPRFNVDESVLWKGSAVFVSLAEDFLNSKVHTMLTIRTAIEAEFPAVRTFYHTLIDQMAYADYKPGWEKDVYPANDYLLEAIRTRTLYIDTADGAIVAAMIVNHACNDGYQGVAWGVEANAAEVTVIHALGVMPDFSGKGLAKRMVAHAIELARRTGQKALRLDVLSGNLPAERLYTGMGFRYVTTVPMFYEDTGWTDFLLYEYLI